jgi:hypothetical protein
MTTNPAEKTSLGADDSGQNKKGETVIGSGFGYDEQNHPTDERIPIEKAMQGDIVELPDLGIPNHP